MYSLHAEPLHGFSNLSPRILWCDAGEWWAEPGSVSCQPAGPGAGEQNANLIYSEVLVCRAPYAQNLTWHLHPQLQSDVACCFSESLQRRLLEVEGLYSQMRSRYTFIQALVRRIRGLLCRPKS